MSRQCFIDGCYKPHRARNLCKTHYERQRRHGDAEVVNPRGYQTLYTRYGVVYSSHELASIRQMGVATDDTEGYIARLAALEKRDADRDEADRFSYPHLFGDYQIAAD